jgi:hypothetical protein
VLWSKDIHSATEMKYLTDALTDHALEFPPLPTMPMFTLHLEWDKAVCAEGKSGHECDFGHHTDEESARVMADYLRTNPRLDTLYLHGTAMTAAPLRVLLQGLKNNRVLTTLHLRHNNINAVTAAVLASFLRTNPHLRTLDLAWNNIDAAGVVALAKALEQNDRLEQLNLQNNQVDDIGAQALGNLLTSPKSMLTHLNLRENRIGSSGAASLATALKTNRRLTELNLRANVISDWGALAMAEMLRINHKLTHVYLLGNDAIEANGRGAQALGAATAINIWLVDYVGPGGFLQPLDVRRAARRRTEEEL